jgi:hypothetical protein
MELWTAQCGTELACNQKPPRDLQRCKEGRGEGGGCSAQTNSALALGQVLQKRLNLFVCEVQCEHALSVQNLVQRVTAVRRLSSTHPYNTG